MVEPEREHWCTLSIASRSEGRAYSMNPSMGMPDGQTRRFTTWCVTVHNAAGEIEDWSGIMLPAETTGLVASGMMRHGLEQAVEVGRIGAGHQGAGRAARGSWRARRPSRYSTSASAFALIAPAGLRWASEAISPRRAMTYLRTASPMPGCCS